MNNAVIGLSRPMIDALDQMARDRDCALVLHASQWWAPLSVETHPMSGIVSVPKWWADYRTVFALLRRGLIARTNGVRGDHRQTVILTAHGHLTIKKLRDKGHLPSRLSTGPGKDPDESVSPDNAMALPDGAGPRTTDGGPS